VFLIQLLQTSTSGVSFFRGDYLAKTKIVTSQASHTGWNGPSYLSNKFTYVKFIMIKL